MGLPDTIRFGNFWFLGSGQLFDRAFMQWKTSTEIGAAGQFEVFEIETWGYGASYERE
jgi:hypothetical protein